MKKRVIGLGVVLALFASPTVGQFRFEWPCDSHSWLQTVASIPPVTLFVCPEGDTDSFIEQGWWIGLEIVQDGGSPGIPGIEATSFWLEDCDPARDVALCGGELSSNADSVTNDSGMTTMSLTTLSGGGCADGMAVKVLGYFLLDTKTGCTVAECLPIYLRSPDIDGNLEVDVVDLSLLAMGFPPNPLETCCDMNLDGQVGLVDLTLFAAHFGPPGHRCM